MISINSSSFGDLDGFCSLESRYNSAQHGIVWTGEADEAPVTTTACNLLANNDVDVILTVSTKDRFLFFRLFSWYGMVNNVCSDSGEVQSTARWCSWVAQTIPVFHFRVAIQP